MTAFCDEDMLAADASSPSFEDAEAGADAIDAQDETEATASPAERLRALEAFSEA